MFIAELGGSSLVNFQCWVAPPSQDLDAVEALGNPGWGWNDYVKYQVRILTQVKTAPPRHSEALDRMFFNTTTNLGIEENLDPYNGNNAGLSLMLGSSYCCPSRYSTIYDICFAANLDPKTWRRSTSVAAYYEPVKDRSNLVVTASLTHYQTIKPLLIFLFIRLSQKPQWLVLFLIIPLVMI
jgi:choline dehydrogenase-like flavoprotein